MDQLHRRFSDEQVKLLLQRYAEGEMARSEIQEILGIGKTRLFALLKAWRRSPEDFSIAYERATPGRLSPEAEDEIAQELRREQQLVEDPQLPISNYNYTALRDRLRKKKISVSVPTIIQRAKEMECYRPMRKRKDHDRVVVTSAIGALVQHDASLHLWSPYAQAKWALITSIDDFSRLLLYAELVTEESSWAHIQAAQALMQGFGLPLRYYVDNLRVFRFVAERDSVWRKQILDTDNLITQWRQVLATLKVDVSYALSPQAKGKVERPYRWLQDRIVRTCALEKLSDIADVRSVLKAEVDRYNNHQVHSTTGEIPRIRFEKAHQAGNSLFRPFALPQPYKSPKDVFCLHHSRRVNGYRKISFLNQEIEVPHVPLREIVDLHIIPDPERQAFEIRIWWEKKMVRALHLPLPGKPVHF